MQIEIVCSETTNRAMTHLLAAGIPAPGSRERLAFALFIHTGQRASDVARMSWVDVEREGIRQLGI
jgi:integrase